MCTCASPPPLAPLPPCSGAKPSPILTSLSGASGLTAAILEHEAARRSYVHAVWLRRLTNRTAILNRFVLVNEQM